MAMEGGSMRALAFVLLGVLFFLATADAQVTQGFAPCASAAPTALTAGVASTNTNIGGCGTTAIVYNTGTITAFYTVGPTNATVATVTSQPLPGNTFVQIAIPLNAGSWFFAAITAAGSSSLLIASGSTK
jgi:hypothetical protein